MAAVTFENVLVDAFVGVAPGGVAKAGPAASTRLVARMKRATINQFEPRIVGLPSRVSAMMRCWISEVPSKILVSRASRQ